jgi:hypothetical protein
LTGIGGFEIAETRHRIRLSFDLVVGEFVRFFVGITDRDWFDFLSRLNGLDEVNFWQPSGQLHFDHIIPYSKGGSSKDPANIQILCGRHNLAKHDKIE